jgi:hypothetical protein
MIQSTPTRFNPSPQILEQFKRQLTLHHTIRYSQSGGQTDVISVKPLWAHKYDFQIIFRFTDLYDHESGHYRYIARLSLIQNMRAVFEWNEINVPYLKDGSPKSNYWPHMDLLRSR